MTHLPPVTISGLALSDLFFNSEEAMAVSAIKIEDDADRYSEIRDTACKFADRVGVYDELVNLQSPHGDGFDLLVQDFEARL